MSKYDQNLNSFNSKKYIANVKKVTAMLSKADTLTQEGPESKLFDIGNESQGILRDRVSQKLCLSEVNAPKLKYENNGGDHLDYDVLCKQYEIYGYPQPVSIGHGLGNSIYTSNRGEYCVKDKIIPSNSINVCIKCINNYSSEYLAKLLEINHINPKQIDTYIIRDSYSNMIIPQMKTKKIPWEMDVDKCYTFLEKEKSQIPLFFVKLFNNRIVLPLLILFRKWGAVCMSLFLIRWLMYDKNREYYQYIENNKNSRECQRPSGYISLLQNYIEDYLNEIANKPNSRYVKNGVVRLKSQEDLGILKYKNSDSSDLRVSPALRVGVGVIRTPSPCIPMARVFQRRGRNFKNNDINSGNIHVFKIESAKFLQLLNFKSFFTLFSAGKGELKLLDRFKVQKRIVEGKLWDILNLYLTNNELYSLVLSSLKKQAVKDYNLAKYDIIEPDMLSLYQDKINNITHKTIFHILKNEWYDIKWIISFKFDTVFLDEHRDILIMNLKENINQDYLFFNLINNLFNMEMIGLENNKSMSRYNIFEHDKLSQFLLNIFFCKLDKKVNELKYNYYEKYNKLLWLKFWNLKLKDQNSDSQKLARDVIIEAKLNFKFIRYLDTFIIGMNGTKSEVNEIREILNSFLKSELQLNNLYSYIIDIHNDNLKFMNINISSGLFYGNKYKIIFQFPKQLIIKALINSGILNNKRIPICKKNLLKYNLNIIINTYIDIHYFVLSSFAICHDFSNLNRLLSFYINCSLKLTLQAKLDKKLWNRVIAPITPIKRYSKIYGLPNSWKYIWQRSSISLEKRLRLSNLNILLLFRLGLITSKIFKKLYYFRINNKKYLKRKYTNKNCSSNCDINNINWESNVNFDFLISNYYDSSIPFVNKSRVGCMAPAHLKVLSFDHPRRLL